MGDLRCSLNDSPKVPEDSPIYSLSHSTVTPVSINHPTFLDDGIFVFGGHQDVFDCLSSFKVDFNSMLSACILKTLINAFGIWHHYVCFVLVARCFGVNLLFIIVIFHKIWLGTVLYLHPVQGPHGIYTF